MIELIKWGGSRLRNLDDLNEIVDLINIYVKDNKKVICVLSAFKNYTDMLINKYKEEWAKNLINKFLLDMESIGLKKETIINYLNELEGGK